MKKCLISFILGGLLFSGLTILAYSYNAKDISYQPSNSSWKVNSVKDAIDSIKTTNDTTISNLQSSNQSMQDEITSLNNELTTLQSFSKSKSLSFKSSTQTQTFNLGFRPNYIYCFGIVNSKHVIIIYNKDVYDNVIGINNAGMNNAYFPLSSWYTINDNGFSWNITGNDWNNVTVNCTASS